MPHCPHLSLAGALGRVHTSHSGPVGRMIDPDPSVFLLCFGKAAADACGNLDLTSARALPGRSCSSRCKMGWRAEGGGEMLVGATRGILIRFHPRPILKSLTLYPTA